jgi:hypothetical protein
MREGLIGLWHFDETTGTMAADSSGNGNQGILRFADSSSVWVPGRFGNALAVEAGGYVLVPFSSTIDGIATGVTISAWVFLEGTINETDLYGTAISRQIPTGNGLEQYYHLSLRNTNGEAVPNLFMSPTLPTVQMWGKAVALNTWVHLAGTYDEAAAGGNPSDREGIATLYVNGAPVSSKMIAGRFPADNTPVILGGNANGASVTELFPGRIDEITLYNRALSAEEIAELAQGPVL